MKNSARFGVFFHLMAALVFLVAGCATTVQYFEKENGNLPPILSQDEVQRPYAKLARVEITREMYAFAFDGIINPDIKAWGFAALRREAGKLGADAVIFPEITGQSVTGVVLPSTEYRASGIAIKFK